MYTLLNWLKKLPANQPTTNAETTLTAEQVSTFMDSIPAEKLDQTLAYTLPINSATYSDTIPSSSNTTWEEPNGTIHEVIDLISSDEEEVEMMELSKDNVQQASSQTSSAPVLIDLTSSSDGEDDIDSQLEEIHRRIQQGRVIKHKRGEKVRRPLHRQLRRSASPVKNTKILSRRARQIDAPNIFSESCLECSQIFNIHNQPLSNRATRNLCEGCFSLERAVSKRGECANDCKHWLLTGELKRQVWEEEVDNEREMEIVKKRAKRMRKRKARRTRRMSGEQTSDSNVASRDALYDLYVDSICKCAITGWTCHFPRHTNRQRFWSVSFDHIVPVSTAPPGMNPWNIENIQVMCHLMNDIKGNYPDEELRRWFNKWKEGRGQV